MTHVFGPGRVCLNCTGRFEDVRGNPCPGRAESLGPARPAASIIARAGDLVQPCGCILVRRKKPTGEPVVSLIPCTPTCEVAAATLDFARSLGKDLTFDPVEEERVGADWKGLGR
jgi:hypothetical protein